MLDCNGVTENEQSSRGKKSWAEGEGKMKKRIIQPWTPEDDNRLRKLAAEGRTSVTIAERMKRTPASVRSRAKAINVVFLKAKGN
ncbi:SANT/Myb-like DNA-binding domain-containing protein [Bradyrhizobium sp. JYMT SZCCT0428]|uniref:SANT/Myb-like DNA-binding domain-containing protein n=1 Tax=Bradyrhizobium sp. JYMT SZCCT0428 TaxID=2807673 RepID=UPI001BA767D6|nr:SANT/Myb-like DNA-binding domain-containing protein [Bradyrhizobium sp. JYMT SZCCT0428]MBR1157375.1 SANT/Myb domain-containing protein [Bradyrhizobium sp. JYMT SZCCT0428]